MAFKSIIGATCACLAVVTFSADAALVGRLAATSGGTDYQAYYDDVADLTWLADANAVVGTPFDTVRPGEGLVSWAAANQWAADLVVDGNDTWRLAASDEGCSGLNCTGSEMGSLFYTALGNTAGSLTNTGPFSNVQRTLYWSATEYATDTRRAWEFSMNDGFQAFSIKTFNRYAWAVQSGDVSAVPVPAAVWLFGSGLIGLIGVARRKKS